MPTAVAAAPPAHVPTAVPSSPALDHLSWSGITTTAKFAAHVKLEICGKTDVLLAFKKMLGADNVLQFDATSTTEAGARRELRQLANIPPILICEEIEKTDERSLRWLLGVLDTRGEIRGLNFRDASFQRDVKLLCLATVNDMKNSMKLCPARWRHDSRTKSNVRVPRAKFSNGFCNAKSAS